MDDERTRIKGIKGTLEAKNSFRIRAKTRVMRRTGPTSLGLRKALKKDFLGSTGFVDGNTKAILEVFSLSFICRNSSFYWGWRRIFFAGVPYLRVTLGQEPRSVPVRRWGLLYGNRMQLLARTPKGDTTREGVGCLGSSTTLSNLQFGLCDNVTRDVDPLGQVVRRASNERAAR